MSSKTFDLDDARDEMRDAIEAQDTEAIIRIFKMVRRHRDEAAKVHDIERRMRLERLLGQWLTKLEEDGLLVETH